MKVKQYHIILISAILCIASCKPNAKQNTDARTEAINAPVLLTEQGDTIPTGVSIERQGKVIPLNEMLPPLVIDAKPQVTTITSQPKVFDFTLTETYDFPKADTIFFGKNGIKEPVRRKAIVKRTKAKYPKVTTAAPFFKKGIEDGPIDYLTIQQGMQSNLIYDILEDNRGFIWISSKSGLSRYDGKTFRHYDREHGLPIEIVNGLCQDSLGNIWMSANDYEGLIKFDGQYFYEYIAEGGAERPYANAQTIGLRIDQNGDFLFNADVTSKENGVAVKFDGTYFIEYGEQQGLKYKLWPKWLNINDQTYYWTLYSLNLFGDDYILSYDINKVVNASVYQFIQGLNKEVWFGLNGKVCKIEGQQIFCYHADILEEDKVMSINFNQHGQLLLGHKSGSTSIIENNSLKLIQKRKKFNQDYQPIEDCEKINGKFWKYNHNTLNGIERFDPNAFQLNPDLDMMCSMLQDKNGNLWFGSHGKGLQKEDNFTSTTYSTVFQKVYEYLNSKKGNHEIIRAIYEDSQGNIWIGAREGVLIFDGIQFTYYNLQSKPDEIIGMINSIAEDGNGNMWFGTVKGGLIKFDGQQFAFFKNSIETKHSRNSNHIKVIQKGRDGSIWIGSIGSGLAQYNAMASKEKGKDIFKYYTKKEGLCSNFITSIFEDSKGILWIGSGNNGISRFDGTSFINYSKADGLSNNDVWSIIEDTQENIWLAVDDCLDLLFFEEDNKTLASVTTYCDFSGQSGKEFFSNANMIDHKNNLYWGLLGYTVQINSNSILPNAEAPNIYLDEIEINQHQLDFSKGLIAKQNNESFLFGKDQQFDLAVAEYKDVAPFYNYPTDLSLPHDLNSLSFQFSATNDPDLMDVKFKYYLEGSDKEWSEPNLENKANYRNLSPGKYTFKVKAAGKNSIWSAPFEYSFSISPPWWKTIYAYFAYFLVLGGTLFYVYQFNLKRRLEQAETSRIKELNNLKTRLYTNITHEFRTPLTVIMGMNENIKDNQQEKKLIRRNSKNLLRLVNQLLDLSKLESGTMKMDQIQGDIVVYLQYLTESFHSMAEEKGIRLTFYSEEESLIMDYDEVKIQHIIYNLLSNAIKFTPAGGKVILHLSQTEEAGLRQLKLKVKDTGIGIPEDKQLHIFDRFYQVDGSYTRKGEGTGIGLALTKELINMMKGEIEVQSKIDKGTEFMVWLPIHNNAESQSSGDIDELYFEAQEKEIVPVSTTEDQLDIPVANQKNKPEVLLIEDNKDVSTYIESLLRADYTVHQAVNGQLGIDAAIELIPDIIISDIMMPEKDGFEVCQTLKQDARTSHIPIVLLTAKAAQSDKVQGLKFGADAFLSKPFDKTELFVRLEKLIEIRKQLQERYSGLVYTKEAYLKSENKVKNPKANLEDAFLKEIRDQIEENYSNPDFGVNELAKAIFMSHTQVYRKIKALTGKTPSQFIRSIRLNKGLDLLQNSNLNISEIAYDVGFSDPNYFSRTFQQEFGKAPRDIRN